MIAQFGRIIRRNLGIIITQRTQPDASPDCISVAVLTIFAVALITGCASAPTAGPEAGSKAETSETAPVLATEISGIIHSYDQYNAQLKKLNLPDPMSLNVFRRINTDSIKRYYTKAMNRAHDQCFSNANCRMSDVIGLRVETMMNYRVINLQARDSSQVTLVVIGTNPNGAQRKVIVQWLLEGGEWRIDKTISGPPNW